MRLFPSLPWGLGALFANKDVRKAATGAFWVGGGERIIKGEIELKSG